MKNLGELQPPVKHRELSPNRGAHIGNSSGTRTYNESRTGSYPNTGVANRYRISGIWQLVKWQMTASVEFTDLQRYSDKRNRNPGV